MLAVPICTHYHELKQEFKKEMDADNQARQ